MIFGYARVLMDGQDVASQVISLQDAWEERVFREVAIGAKTERPVLREAIARFALQDVLMVTRLDRLARVTRGVLCTLLCRSWMVECW